jgi:hypothetical protein
MKLAYVELLSFFHIKIFYLYTETERRQWNRLYEPAHLNLMEV